MDDMNRRIDYGIVRGGQGRSSREVQDEGFWFGVSMVCVIVITVLGLLGLFRG